VAVDRVNLFLALGGGWEEEAREGSQKNPNPAERAPQAAQQSSGQAGAQQSAHE
jgi:hypothetical protein